MRDRKFRPEIDFFLLNGGQNASILFAVYCGRCILVPSFLIFHQKIQLGKIVR